jgi:hypothetical protein
MTYMQCWVYHVGRFSASHGNTAQMFISREKIIVPYKVKPNTCFFKKNKKNQIKVTQEQMLQQKDCSDYD